MVGDAPQCDATVGNIDVDLEKIVAAVDRFFQPIDLAATALPSVCSLIPCLFPHKAGTVVRPDLSIRCLKRSGEILSRTVGIVTESRLPSVRALIISSI